MAKISSISFDTLMSLGMTEDRTIEQIKNNIEIPDYPKYKNDQVNLVMLNYFYSMLNNINQTKYNIIEFRLN